MDGVEFLNAQHGDDSKTPRRRLCYREYKQRLLDKTTPLAVDRSRGTFMQTWSSPAWFCSLIFLSIIKWLNGEISPIHGLAQTGGIWHLAFRLSTVRSHISRIRKRGFTRPGIFPHFPTSSIYIFQLLVGKIFHMFGYKRRSKRCL